MKTVLIGHLAIASQAAAIAACAVPEKPHAKFTADPHAGRKFRGAMPDRPHGKFPPAPKPKMHFTPRARGC